MKTAKVNKLSLLLLVILAVSNVPPRPRSQRQLSSCKTLINNRLLNFDYFSDLYTIMKILFIFFSPFLTLLYHSAVRLSVRYATFDTNIHLLKRYTSRSFLYLTSWISASLFVLLILENHFHMNVSLVFHLTNGCPFPSQRTCTLRFARFLPHLRVSFAFITYLQITASAFSPTSYVLCLYISYAFCCHLTRKTPPWVPFLLILLSNDIEFNQGPLYSENFLNIIKWNLNSLTKNDFKRVQLIEAHNSIYN